MRVLGSFEEFRVSDSPLVMALGNFDGLHLGHQKLLDQVKQSAEACRGISAVFTFRDHPQAVLYPSKTPPMLHSIQHKIWMLQEQGLDFCFLLPFTPEFSRLSAEEFVEDILVAKLHVKKVFLGENARFGHGRRGDAEMMRVLAARFGFDFQPVAPVSVMHEMVSSSRIRRLIQEGHLKEAQACLGQPYRILGEVVSGDGRGSGLGFPTANLKLNQDVMPPEGVYAVKARTLPEETRGAAGCAGKWMKGLMNFGKRPTFHTEPKAPQVAEIFILEEPGSKGALDLYGKSLEVAFWLKLREEKKFSNAEELKSQIQKDVQTAQSLFFNDTGEL